MGRPPAEKLTDYVEQRNALIPEAEALASAAADRKKQPALWSAAFCDAMDRLAFERLGVSSRRYY
jgi:hypothetical protein